jgi:hypothetical protein
MNRPPGNRCFDCDRPVVIHGNNWSRIIRVQNPHPALRVTLSTGTIIGYAHQVCPNEKPGEEALW